MSGGRGTRPGPALPARLAPAPVPGALQVDADVVLEAVAGAAAADGPADVAAAVLRALVRLPGVRAALVARAPRPGADPVVLASAGYDCTTTAPGAELPLGAGLPLTECVRTGELQVVGRGPSWAAVPAGPGAALLVSLVCPPPEGASLEALARLGRLLDGALVRAGRDEQARTRLAVLEQGLSGAVPLRSGAAVRSRPFSGALSGDVVTLVDDGPRVQWLLLADVCGRGTTAAVGADRLQAAFRACAPGAEGPVEVLARLDRVLDGGEEAFATALVLRVAPDGVRLASAGHPAPVLHPGGRVALVPGPPLGLGLADSGPPPVERVLPPAGAVLLVAATDGLTDRGGEVDLDAVVARLAAGLGAEEAADAVLAACAAQGPPQDDATLVVLALGAA